MFDLQALLAAGYTTFTGLLELNNINDGFEQLFALGFIPGGDIPIPTPEPTSLLLLVAGLPMILRFLLRRNK